MYSRRINIEEKKNKSKAISFSLLTFIGLIIIILYGPSSLAKFAAFISDLNKTSQPADTQDTNPPPVPRIEDIPKATNKPKLELRGTTEPGATVYIFLNSKKNEVLANRNGFFSTTLNLDKGENVIFASARDSSGNESSKTQALKIVYDTDAPQIQILKPSDKSEFFGSRQRQIVIEGKTEQGAKLQINNRLVIIESDGSFTFASTLDPGENKFSVKVEDEAGNVNETSFSVNFTP